MTGATASVEANGEAGLKGTSVTISGPSAVRIN
jgi:hypothetical protein